MWAITARPTRANCHDRPVAGRLRLPRARRHREVRIVAGSRRAHHSLYRRSNRALTMRGRLGAAVARPRQSRDRPDRTTHPLPRRELEERFVRLWPRPQSPTRRRCRGARNVAPTRRNGPRGAVGWVGHIDHCGPPVRPSHPARRNDSPWDFASASTLLELATPHQLVAPSRSQVTAPDAGP